MRVLSAADYGRCGAAAPPHFRLLFPPRWRAEPVENRYAPALELETIAWLRSYGIGETAAEAEKLRRFDCGKYGGYSMPLADLEAGLLVTQYISLWLFWDDAQVERQVTWDIDDVLAALLGRRRAPPSRYLDAWADLGRRLRRARSERWMRRIGASMRQWLENAKRETAMARALKRRGVLPDFEALFDCRTVSIGMYPTFHLMEHAEGFELPDAVHDHAAVVDLKRSASRLVGLGNDLGGLAKDLRDGWLNLVLVLVERSRVALPQAFEAVVRIHNDEVRAFDRLAAALPSFGPGLDVLVRGWVQAVRHNVYGFALWESLAERYQRYKALAGDQALVAAVSIADATSPA
ncbi:terpene synthase family protein [Sorangium sp. So ce341]|uniref:terpene synthase family protein n=1 Tax=Sorangium sp. So ce341 TaxID=3133302 RepID=UPI003F5E8D0F